ncbi:toll/interleukin-1 receptor domain-containing protein [Agrobacterium fabrum]|uniref:Molecular chaperone Tir n=1 Tax=Agrobacterium tumefaciens TaxID=358 RepID=A0A176WW00_AGRTU|nr:MULTISPECIES: toll/interleukin-1 receptor domain-containing protein [Agrobacterium tumefaciens complex]AYM62020.1 hypothetical protein At12D13_08550 [Agrobacterium fabrum]NTE60124.1 toll/interleukin-1 receptor domain-containing protein [Agrobacterium fabrum]OAE37565.1 molecular chaperone Tir [Agrobacterium tumefaciens]
MSYIFLSHSHADKPFARKLAADLRSHGHSVWIDEAEINIGDSLIEKIREGLDKVDYVCAVLSKSSVGSAWVQRELDLASNREIDEKRVVVLPVLIEDVQLPGFLKGKFYGDCRTEEKYPDVVLSLVRAVGGSLVVGTADKDEIAALKEALEHARRQAAANQQAAQRAENAAFRSKSDKVKAAIAQANKKFPTHAAINNTYAFEINGDGIPITLDYLFWAISKSIRRGAPHPLDALLTITNQWPDAENMLSAYKDMIDQDVAQKRV